MGPGRVRRQCSFLSLHVGGSLRKPSPSGKKESKGARAASGIRSDSLRKMKSEAVYHFQNSWSCMTQRRGTSGRSVGVAQSSLEKRVAWKIEISGRGGVSGTGIMHARANCKVILGFER